MIEKSVKRQSGIRAMPAGTEMNVRTIGKHPREEHGQVSPAANQRSASSRSWALMNT